MLFLLLRVFAPCSYICTGYIWVPNNVASDACTALTLLTYDEAVVLRIALLAGVTIRVTTALKLSA